MRFTNYKKFNILDKKAYIDKQSFNWKCADAAWKFALIVEMIKEKIIVELKNDDIRNVPGNDLFYVIKT